MDEELIDALRIFASYDPARLGYLPLAQFRRVAVVTIASTLHRDHTIATTPRLCGCRCVSGWHSDVLIPRELQEEVEVAVVEARRGPTTPCRRGAGWPGGARSLTD